VTGGFPIPSGQQNLSLLAGVMATASTEANSTTWVAAHAVDGLGLSWCMGFHDPAQVMTIDFPSSVTVEGIGVRNHRGSFRAFLSGVFHIFDGAGGTGMELYNSGVVSFPSGETDLTLPSSVSGAWSLPPIRLVALSLV